MSKSAKLAWTTMVDVVAFDVAVANPSRGSSPLPSRAQPPGIVSAARTPPSARSRVVGRQRADGRED